MRGTGLVAGTLISFNSWFVYGIQNYPLAYLPYPFLVWGALRFGQRGAATGTLLVSALAIHSFLSGRGPFQASRLGRSDRALEQSGWVTDVEPTYNRDTTGIEPKYNQTTTDRRPTSSGVPRVHVRAGARGGPGSGSPLDPELHSGCLYPG